MRWFVPRNRLAHAGFELRQFQEVPSVERKALNLIAADDAADLMIVAINRENRAAGGGAHV
jgi:hypothetical protein